MRKNVFNCDILSIKSKAYLKDQFEHFKDRKNIKLK